MKLQKASKDDDDGDGDDDGVTSSQAGRLKTRQRGVAAGAGRAGCHLHGYTCWQRHLLKNFAGEK